MGKTETIKDRRVDVYLDTLDRKERWKELAEEQDDSLSQFVQRAVEYAIQHGGVDYAELGEQSQQIQELEQQVTELREQVKQKDIVIEKLEDDLREYRAREFDDDEFEGIRQYNQELVELLQSRDHVTGDDLRRRLNVDPTDTDAMQAIDSQLEQLAAYGLVENSAQGWEWTG
jgi:uncharacterized coiled-coil protein SlyX